MRIPPGRPCERWHQGGCRRGHLGQCVEPGNQLVERVQIVDTTESALVVLGDELCGCGEVGEDDLFLGNAEIRSLQIAKAPRNESGCGQNNDRERRLEHDHALPGTLRTPVESAPIVRATSADRTRICASNPKPRGQTEQHRRQDRHRRPETERATVDPDLLQPWESARRQRN